MTMFFGYIPWILGFPARLGLGFMAVAENENLDCRDGTTLPTSMGAGWS